MNLLAYVFVNGPADPAGRNGGSAKRGLPQMAAFGKAVPPNGPGGFRKQRVSHQASSSPLNGVHHWVSRSGQKLLVNRASQCPSNPWP